MLSFLGLLECSRWFGSLSLSGHNNRYLSALRTLRTSFRNNSKVSGGLFRIWSHSFSVFNIFFLFFLFLFFDRAFFCSVFFLFVFYIFYVFLFCVLVFVYV